MTFRLSFSFSLRKIDEIRRFFLSFVFHRNPLRSSADLLQRFYDVIEKECKKESLAYRSMAIRVLSLLADEFQFEVFHLFWIWFEKAFKPEVKPRRKKRNFSSISFRLGAERRRTNDESNRRRRRSDPFRCVSSNVNRMFTSSLASSLSS